MSNLIQILSQLKLFRLFYFNFLALLLALVSRGNERQANVPMFEAPYLSRGIVHNVCVSAVVRFRSRFLAHETKRGTKIETYSLQLTAPLQKHFVSVRYFISPFVILISPSIDLSASKLKPNQVSPYGNSTKAKLIQSMSPVAL